MRVAIDVPNLWHYEVANALIVGVRREPLRMQVAVAGRGGCEGRGSGDGGDRSHFRYRTVVSGDANRLAPLDTIEHFGEPPRCVWGGHDLLVVGPHSQDVDHAFVGEDLIDQTVLDVDSPGVAARQIADEFLVSRWGGEGVLGNQVQQPLGFGLQA